MHRHGGVVAINHDRREVIDRALHKARVAGYGQGEFVGQESFMRASDILRLAERAHIGPDTSVLDVCCGVGGPGLLIADALGCDYHGVDASASAIRIARSRVGTLNCRFDVSEVPPLPAGGYDVILLLETLLAFPDKTTLLTDAFDRLAPGGRFAFTFEEGDPLSEAERARMPDAHSVWLVPLSELLSTLETTGLQVTWMAECTASHREVAQRLHASVIHDAKSISKHIGMDACESLLTAHQLWIDWLGCGRVRKFAVIAERTDSQSQWRTDARPPSGCSSTA